MEGESTPEMNFIENVIGELESGNCTPEKDTGERILLSREQFCEFEENEDVNFTRSTNRASDSESEQDGIAFSFVNVEEDGDDAGNELKNENNEQQFNQHTNEATAPAVRINPSQPSKTPVNIPKVIKTVQEPTINGSSIYDYDLQVSDKPWNKPGADITDYFNYGFTEETWNEYCERQRIMRSQNNSSKGSAILKPAVIQGLQPSLNLLNTLATTLPTELQPPELRMLLNSDIQVPQPQKSTNLINLPSVCTLLPNKVLSFARRMNIPIEISRAFVIMMIAGLGVPQSIKVSGIQLDKNNKLTLNMTQFRSQFFEIVQSLMPPASYKKNRYQGNTSRVENDNQSKDKQKEDYYNSYESESARKGRNILSRGSHKSRSRSSSREYEKSIKRSVKPRRSPITKDRKITKRQDSRSPKRSRVERSKSPPPSGRRKRTRSSRSPVKSRTRRSRSPSRASKTESTRRKDIEKGHIPVTPDNISINF